MTSRIMAPAFALLLACLFMPVTGGAAAPTKAKTRHWFNLPSFAQVGLIEVWGDIMDPAPYVRQVRKLDRNPLVKGIILRVESPGGDVGAVQEIYDELLRYKEAKPGRIIVASFGGVAASGGYYLACAADRIFSNPGTLTGSIGVKMEFVDAEDLMKKVGVRYSVVKSGRFKDIGNFARKMDPEELALLQSTIDDVYEQFLDAVATARTAKVKEALARERGKGAPKPTDRAARAFIRSISDGRVFSGRQAEFAGLVDEMGGLDDAIDAAGEMLGTGGRPSVVSEKRRKESNWWDMFSSVLLGPAQALSPNRGSGPRLRYSL